MFSDLIIAYSSWYILLALLAGLIYAGILYFRNRSNKIGIFWTVVLFILRFVSIFVLAVLLLSPYFNIKEKYFDTIRDAVDKLELLVDDEDWPLVKYRELLFLR